MLVERMLTVERRNALGVLLGDSRIVEVASCLDDVKDPGILLCWWNAGALHLGCALCALCVLFCA